MHWKVALLFAMAVGLSVVAIVTSPASSGMEQESLQHQWNSTVVVENDEEEGDYILLMPKHLRESENVFVDDNTTEAAESTSAFDS